MSGLLYRSPVLMLFGAALASACVLLLGAFNAEAALGGWLAGVALASSLPFGTIFLVLLLRIVPGKWRDDLLPLAEFPLFSVALLLPAILPVLLFAGHLYGWAGSLPLHGFQAVYLGRLFLSLRSLVLLTLALMLAFWLLRRPAVKAVAVIGMIAFVPLHGLLAIDWILSLDPRFHASGFGLYFLCIQALTALCMLIIAKVATATPQHPTILAGLLLTGILLWGYFAFLQYLITWSDNLPAGAAWYQRRGDPLWHLSEVALTVLRLVPGLLLLFEPVRRSPSWLSGLALAVLLGSVIEMAWLVLPEAGDATAMAIAAYLLSIASIGLAFLAALEPARRLHHRLPADRQVTG